MNNAAYFREIFLENLKNHLKETYGFSGDELQDINNVCIKSWKEFTKELEEEKKKNKKK